MADICNELLNEIQPDIAGLKEGRRDLCSDNLSIRNQLHHMQGDMNGMRASVAHIEQRLDRIDIRLDLREVGEAGAPFQHDG